MKAGASTSAGRPDEAGLCCVGSHRISGSAYEFRDGRRCRRHAVVHPPTLARSIKVAVIVGSALFLINQLDVVLRTGITVLLAAKIVLTYCVPFAVATFGALSGVRDMGR